MIIEKFIEFLASVMDENMEDYTVIVPLGRQPKRINCKNEHFGIITHECDSKIVLENDDLEIIMQVKA